MKKVLITAGASGIGRTMAEAFAAEGTEVWITDLSEPALKSCPADWHRIHANVIDQAKVAGIIADMGTSDVPCAKAGVAGPTARVENIALAD